jgi:hypothetical protein
MVTWQKVYPITSRSLAQHWQDLVELKRQIEMNPRFEAFVLRHLDSTAARDDVEAIVDNATKRCPEESKPLCSSMISAAQVALEEIRKANHGDGQPRSSRAAALSTEGGS